MSLTAFSDTSLAEQWQALTTRLMQLALVLGFCCLPGIAHADDAKCMDLSLFLGNSLTAEMQEHLVHVARTQPAYRNQLCNGLNLDCSFTEMATCDDGECVTEELNDRESVAVEWLEEEEDVPSLPGLSRACFYDPDLCSSLPPLPERPIFAHTIVPVVTPAPSVPEQKLYSQMSQQLAISSAEQFPADGVRRRVERPPRA